MEKKDLKSFTDIFKSNLAKQAIKEEKIVAKNPNKLKTSVKKPLTENFNQPDMAEPYPEIVDKMKNQFAQEVKDKLNNFEHEILALAKKYSIDTKAQVPGAKTTYKKTAKDLVNSLVANMFT